MARKNRYLSGEKPRAGDVVRRDDGELYVVTKTSKFRRVRLVHYEGLSKCTEEGCVRVVGASLAKRFSLIRRGVVPSEPLDVIVLFEEVL